MVNLEYQYLLMDRYGWLIETITDLSNIEND